MCDTLSITELRDRILTLPALEKEMDILRKEILEATFEVSKLLRQYEKESRDVEQIQKSSLSAFLYQIIGKYEDKLRKEQREEIDAKLAYDRAATHLESLEQEKTALASQITDLQADKKAYNAELENRRRALVEQLAGPEAAEYAELERERSEIISQNTEIRQALSAAAHAKSTAQKALKSLKSAQGWATYDALTRGGIISHMTKYSHIDDAERLFHTLSSQLRYLQAELKDVQGLNASGLQEISSDQRAVDFWFDNIFTDLSVRRKVMDNADEIERVLRSIRTVESKLNTRRKHLESRLEKNKSREESLLLSV